jgi:phosphate-selective porin OprO and OprP
MVRNHWQLSSAVSVAAVLAAGSANAQSSAVSAESFEQMKAQVKALEREVQALKGKGATAEKAPARAILATKAPAPPPAAIAKMSPNNRPSICTADNLNCIALTTRLHFDVGEYRYRPHTALTVPQFLDNGVNARRARIGVAGTFMGDWNYALAFEFGASADGLPPVSGAPATGIHDAFLSYTGLKPLAIEGGYWTVPYTLDWATSSNDLMFMERSAAANIAAGIAAASFRSAFGIRGNDDRLWVGGYVTGPTSGTAHIFTPTATAVGSPGTLGSPGATEQLGAFVRAAYQLLQDKYYSLHVGGDAEFLIKPPSTNLLTLSDRPELRIDPTVILTTGAIANVSGAQVYSAEAAAGYGPLFFQGEYFWYNVDRSLGLPSLDFTGWYAEGGWTLTGESRIYNPATGSYGTILPDHPFSRAMGGLGAWEVAGRYSTVNLNDLFTRGIATSVTLGVAGGTQSISTLGLNWYVNRNVRFTFNYLHGTVDKFSGVAATKGVDIGAKFDALAMRTQVSF